MAVRKDLPNRNTGRDTLMLDQPISHQRLLAKISGSIFSDAKSRCRSGPHRPGRGGSTPPSCRNFFGLQTLIVKLRLLPGRNTVRIRGSPGLSAVLSLKSKVLSPKSKIIQPTLDFRLWTRD